MGLYFYRLGTESMNWKKYLTIIFLMIQTYELSALPAACGGEL